MNEYEIDRARERYANNEILGPAALFLYEYKNIVNTHSDGWPYWGRTCAEQLMQIVSGRTPATPASIAKAKASIKRFCTKRDLPQPPEPRSVVREEGNDDLQLRLIA